MWLLGFSLAAALELRQLPEGTSLLVDERPEVAMLALHMVYPAGASRDPQGRSGLAHLVEHARFYGSAEGYDLRLAELGGQGNAWVDHDVAAYWALVPGGEGKSLLDLERERLQGWKAPDDLAPLLAVLAAESRWREVDPLLRRFWPSGHAYQRPVMGTELEAVRTEELQNFTNKHYDPASARLVLVGTISPALRIFLNSLPPGKTTPAPPPMETAAPDAIREGHRQLWPVPPQQMALRPGLELIAELYRQQGADAYVWIGRQGGLFSVEGTRKGRRDAAAWKQAITSLRRQVEEEMEDPILRAQGLNLCWDWGEDCTPQLPGGFSAPAWAGRLERALRRQEWPEPGPGVRAEARPQAEEVPVSSEWINGNRFQIAVVPKRGGRTAVELSLLCGWDCRELPTTYLENLWGRRPSTLRRRLGGSRVELGCDDQRCIIRVDSLAEELAATLTAVYDWLQILPERLDLPAPSAQAAAVAVVVGRPPERGGTVPPRLGKEELARIREAPLRVVVVGATEGVEAGLKPWRAQALGVANKKAAKRRFVVGAGEPEEEAEAVSLLWHACAPDAPERSAWEVAFLSITGSTTAALEQRLREELGWVYGFALTEEEGEKGSFMRLDLEVPVARQSALRAEVEAVLARTRPSARAARLWEARKWAENLTLGGQAAALGQQLLWKLPPTVGPPPTNMEVERAFSSISAPTWIVGGVIMP